MAKRWTGRARGRIHVPGRMNKTERSYAARLELLQAAGEIHSFRFEPLKLRLADRTFYEPDFMVLLPDGQIEFHEVKGASSSKASVKGAWWTEDGRLKIKFAAEQFPEFVFRGVHPRRGGWASETFSREED